MSKKYKTHLRNDKELQIFTALMANDLEIRFLIRDDVDIIKNEDGGYYAYYGPKGINYYNEWRRICNKIINWRGSENKYQEYSKYINKRIALLNSIIKRYEDLTDYDYCKDLVNALKEEVYFLIGHEEKLKKDLGRKRG